jgi:hypothetical protein
VTEPVLREVVLTACPVELLERSRRHTEALLREFAFISESEDGRESTPAQLLALVDRIRDQIAGLNPALDAQLERARSEGRDLLDVSVMLPANGRDVAVELKRLFDEAEEYCRRGDLLTLEERRDVRAFRNWYLQQYIDQLDGAAPEAWPQSDASAP